MEWNKDQRNPMFNTMFNQNMAEEMEKRNPVFNPVFNQNMAEGMEQRNPVLTPIINPNMPEGGMEQRNPVFSPMFNANNPNMPGGMETRNPMLNPMFNANNPNLQGGMRNRQVFITNPAVFHVMRERERRFSRHPASNFLAARQVPGAYCPKCFKRSRISIVKHRRHLIKLRKKEAFLKTMLEFGITKKLKHYITRELHIADYFEEKVLKFTQNYFKENRHTGPHDVNHMIEAHLKNFKIPTEISEFVVSKVNICFQKLQKELEERIKQI